MPIILVTWEAEIRGIMFPSHPRRIVFETLSQKYPAQNKAIRMAQAVKVPCLASMRP
jgi:hypothetical protein